jgi:choline dehydrogenase-like flavoprotein
MSGLASTCKPALRAVIDRILPHGGGWGGLSLGVDRFVARMLETDAALDAGAIEAGLATLAATARRAGLAIEDMDGPALDALIGHVECEAWFRRLAELVAEGAYADPGNGANPNAATWTAIGYRHGLPDGPSGRPAGPPQPACAIGARPMTDYDVIIVGAGAGGGVAACVLAEAGKNVLLLERGRQLSYANDGHRDHLRNHRLALYGHNTGPDSDDNPRVFVAPDGSERRVRAHEQDAHANAAGVGSGTFVYGGLAWRFHPDDFRMASRYGVPDASSLVDWPIGLEDLAPFYERAEREIGVSGVLTPPDGLAEPMPATAMHQAGRRLQEGAARLGWSTVRPPLLINTRPRDGRGACIGCGSCVGFPCPAGAKNGTHNTVIPRALATGRTILVTGAMAETILQDDRGRVTGVAWRSIAENENRRHIARAGAVVLAAGAIETARLLLASASPAHPNGLGNASGQVGRHLQGHCYPTAYGLFDVSVHGEHGPGVTIATTDFVHGNPGVIGGAMLADDFTMTPVAFWKHALPPELPRWGTQAKDFMIHNYRRVLAVKGPVHEIPNPESRVTLDPAARDRWGNRVARLSGSIHPETLKTAHAIAERAREWLKSAGALSIWGPDPIVRLSAGQHQAGTCRMGTDPRTSVTDRYGRVWGHDNLIVCDASLHPTNGAFNPVLTIMALAFRNAEALASG